MYINVKNIAEKELAGCQPLVEDPNNFELLRDNLTNRIAIYLRTPTSEVIKEAIITEEEEIMLVPRFEYIINELQYEVRIAASWGIDKLNQGYESILISNWAKLIIKRNRICQTFFYVCRTNSTLRCF